MQIYKQWAEKNTLTKMLRRSTWHMLQCNSSVKIWLCILSDSGNDDGGYVEV